MGDPTFLDVLGIFKSPPNFLDTIGMEGAHPRQQMKL
jgi:hypothetical protein